MQNYEPIKIKYDRLAEKFSEREYKNLAILMEHRINLVLNWGKPISERDSLLELGCGDGYFAYFLLKKCNVNYIATDISENMLKKTREKCSLFKNTSISTIRIDINDIERIKSLPTVDVCVGFMRTFFHYAREPLEVLKILRKKVRKKIIVDFNPRKIKEEKVIDIMEKAGFSNVEIRGFFVPQSAKLPKIFTKSLIMTEKFSLIRKLITIKKFNCLVKGEIL